MFLHYDFGNEFSDEEKEQIEIAINEINSIKTFAKNFIDLFSKANNPQGNFQDTLYNPSIKELVYQGKDTISENLKFLKETNNLKKYYNEPGSSINQTNYSQFFEDFNEIDNIYNTTFNAIKKIKPKNPLLKNEIKELLGEEKNFLEKGIDWFKNKFTSIKSSFIDNEQNLSKENSLESKLKISIEDNDLTDEERKQLGNSQQIMINFYKNNFDLISKLENLKNFVENLYDSFYYNHLQDADFLFQLYKELEYKYILNKLKKNEIIPLKKINDKGIIYDLFSSIKLYKLILDQVQKYEFKDENIKDRINEIFKTSDTKEKKEAKNEALTDKEKRDIENTKQEINQKYLKLQDLQKFLKESEKADKELDGLYTLNCPFYQTVNYMLSDVFDTENFQNIMLTEDNYQKLSKDFEHWNFCYDYLILDELKKHKFEYKEFESEIKGILEISNTEEDIHKDKKNEVISYENSDTTSSKISSTDFYETSNPASESYGEFSPSKDILSKGKENASLPVKNFSQDDLSPLDDTLLDDLPPLDDTSLDDLPTLDDILDKLPPLDDTSQDDLPTLDDILDKLPPLDESHENQDNNISMFDTESQIKDPNSQKSETKNPTDETENLEHSISETKTIDAPSLERNTQEIQKTQTNTKDHILAKILLGLIAEKEATIEKEEDNEKKDQIIKEQSFKLKTDSKDKEGINITKKDDLKEFKFSSSNIINNKLNGANDTIEINNGMENSINIKHNASTNPALSSVSASISGLYEKMEELGNTPFTFYFNPKTPAFENAVYETLFKNLKSYNHNIMEAICIKNNTNSNITIKIQDLQNLEFQNVDELKKHINNKKTPYSNGSSELETRISTSGSEDYPFSQNQRT